MGVPAHPSLHIPQFNEQLEGACSHMWTSYPLQTLTTLQAKATNFVQYPQHGGGQSEGLRWAYPLGSSDPSSYGKVWPE